MFACTASHGSFWVKHESWTAVDVSAGYFLWEFPGTMGTTEHTAAEISMVEEHALG